MITNSKINPDFVGPKALFDPYFVPPKLLHRKKEESSLFGLLEDSLKDGFSLNILYQGIDGLGKKAIANKVLSDLCTSHVETPCYKIHIDCTDKSFEDLMLSFFFKVNQSSPYSINLDSFMGANLFTI